jgi:hypothetical protein
MRRLHVNFRKYGKRKDGTPNIKRIVPDSSLPSLTQFLNVLFLWHGADSLLKILELRSKAGCIEQSQHEDSPEMQKDRANGQWARKASDLQYSLLISIMPGTKWVNHRGDTIDIPVGSLLIWRGDYSHAGAAYAEFNARLFICIGSLKYPPSDDVAYDAPMAT